MKSIISNHIPNKKCFNLMIKNKHTEAHNKKEKGFGKRKY